jgi:hypothetical protein
MRLGKWIKVFDRIVPIPMTLAASFGLRDGSQLYLRGSGISDEGSVWQSGVNTG